MPTSKLTSSFLRSAVCGSLAALSLLTFAGCGDVPTDDEVDEARSALNPNSGIIWKTLALPVCWTNPSAATSARRDLVRIAIQNSWEKSSLMRFIGWGTCPSFSGGIRIQITTSATVEPHTNGAGRDMDQGTVPGMVLNLNPTVGTPYCPSASVFGFPLTPDDCLVGHAVHEFGHALGFDGEDQRPDSPLNCEPNRAVFGNVLVGPYDPTSVMNHCNPLRIFGSLTGGDIDGIQQFYGVPATASVGRRKDAIVWDPNSVYFLFGKRYTLFNVGDDHTANYYPKAVKDNWGNWPATWPDGVDAIADYSSTKLYMFRDKEYLRYSKTADAVDAGYPKTLPGGWTNWPTTWTTVDAAARWSNGRLYMFRKGEYLRITIGTTVDSGFPKPIAGNWPIAWTTGFDYVIPYPNGNAYFFKGTQYIRYNMATDVASAPIDIVGSWPGVMF